MTNKQDDRRVQRTKQTLYRALLGLVDEKPFDKITVQEILERANVGRTTFYTHFESKEDLFLGSHEEIIRAISRSFFSEEGDLRIEPSLELQMFLRMSQESRDTYFYLVSGTGGEILQLLRNRIAQYLTEQLRQLFQEDKSSIPFDVLAQHVAGSIVSVISWWMDKRTPHTIEEIAAMLHQMNYVVLRHALGTQI
jgi:AcrR family transcriptional regulator